MGCPRLPQWKERSVVNSVAPVNRLKGGPFFFFCLDGSGGSGESTIVDGEGGHGNGARAGCCVACFVAMCQMEHYIVMKLGVAILQAKANV